MSTSFPLVYAVVPVHNRRELTLRFLKWFTRQTYPHMVILVVDDGSTDGTADAIRAAYPTVRILEGDGDLWWAGATNLGVATALRENADYILTINDDSQGEEDYLRTLVDRTITDPMRIGGSRQMNADQRNLVYTLGVAVGGTMRFCFHLNREKENWEEIARDVPAIMPVDSLCGNGTLIPRTAFEKAGLFDARWMPQYHADTDFVLRAKKSGYHACIVNDAVLWNHIQTPPTFSAWGVLADRRSTYFVPSTWMSLWRYGNRWLAPFALVRICLAGIMPPAWKEKLRSLLKRKRD